MINDNHPSLTNKNTTLACHLLLLQTENGHFLFALIHKTPKCSLLLLLTRLSFRTNSGFPLVCRYQRRNIYQCCMIYIWAAFKLKINKLRKTTKKYPRLAVENSLLAFFRKVFCFCFFRKVWRGKEWIVFFERCGNMYITIC